MKAGPRAAVAGLAASRIREVAEAGRGIEGIIPLWFGEPDVVTPEFIRDAAKRGLDEGRTFYAPNLGTDPLREAIARYLTRLDRPVDAGRVCVTASGVNALMLIGQALLAPGDRIVIPQPVWPNMEGIARVLGAEVAPVPLGLSNGRWSIDLDALFAAVTPATRLLLLNAPGNPTGWMLTEAEQRAILDHCRRTGTWILADDVYDRLTYDLPAAPSFLAIATPEDRVISVNSFSKSWAMTGWRLGWIAAPPALMEALAKLTEFNMSSVPGFVQQAGIAALEEGEGFVAETVARYRRARDLAQGMLAGVPGLVVPVPEGAMYLFLKVEGCTDSLALAKSLLRSARVGLAPGSAFGLGGEGHLRLCFAQSEPLLAEACSRLAQALLHR